MITLGTKHGRNSSFRDYARVLESGEEFRTNGALKGRKGVPETYGRLDSEWRLSVNQAEYVVYSYETPIAWRTPNGWVIPARGTLGFGAESQTTTGHMNKIRSAVDLFTEYAEVPS